MTTGVSDAETTDSKDTEITSSSAAFTQATTVEYNDTPTTNSTSKLHSVVIVSLSKCE